MSNNTTIQISRSRYIERDRGIAVLRLDQHYFYPGEPVEVRYYLDETQTEFDTILAIGISEGYGKDNYKVMSLGGLELVQDVVSELPDVSSLAHGEIYLYQDPQSEIWYYVYEIGGDRQLEQIVGKEMTFVNITDRYRWFWKDGSLKREDSFLTDNLLDNTVDELLKSVYQPYIDAKSISGYLFRAGENIRVILQIKVMDRAGQNCTNDYIIYVDGEEVNLTEEYTWISQPLSMSHDFIITAEPKKMLSSIEIITGQVQVRFGYDIYYGVVSKLWQPDESKVIQLPNVELRARENIRWENINLNNQITAFAYPRVYGKLVHIYDDNGLCLLDDYTCQEVDVLGIKYYVYWKNEPVQVQNAIQEFVFTAEDETLNATEETLHEVYSEVVEAWKKQNMPGGLVTVGSDGRISADLIPPSVNGENYIELQGIVEEYPVFGIRPGQKWYNSTTHKIFVGTSSDSGNVEDPEEDKFYVNLGNNSIYIWKAPEMVNVTSAILSEVITNLDEILE